MKLLTNFILQQFFHQIKSKGKPLDLPPLIRQFDSIA